MAGLVKVNATSRSRNSAAAMPRQPPCIRAQSRGELAHGEQACADLRPEVSPARTPAGGRRAWRRACLRTADGVARRDARARHARRRHLSRRHPGARIHRPARGRPRHLTLNVFYPAAIRERPAPAFVMPFFTKLNLYKDAEPAFGGSKHPLVMFSHERGSNGLYYAWFAEFLAARGYIVAALNHYRANTYDSTIAYLANK